MFTFSPNPEFTWPVTVMIPQDGGKKMPQTFTARFRAAPVDDIEAMMSGDEVVRLPAVEREMRLIGKIVVGWEGISDAAGTPVSFSPEALRQVAGLPYVRRAVTDAYYDAINGKAAAGN